MNDVIIKVNKKCVVCGKDRQDKRYNNHHIDYEKDITIQLCYQCHQWVHGRSTLYHPFITRYGKDKAMIYFAIKFLEVCKNAGVEI